MRERVVSRRVSPTSRARKATAAACFQFPVYGLLLYADQPGGTWVFSFAFTSKRAFNADALTTRPLRPASCYEGMKINGLRHAYDIFVSWFLLMD